MKTLLAFALFMVLSSTALASLDYKTYQGRDLKNGRRCSLHLHTEEGVFYRTSHTGRVDLVGYPVISKTELTDGLVFRGVDGSDKYEKVVQLFLDRTKLPRMYVVLDKYDQPEATCHFVR